VFKIKTENKKILLLFNIFVASFLFGDLKYEDVNREHWAYSAIENLVNKGVLEDNSYKFNGNDPVSRYDFAYNLSKALDKLDGDKMNKNDLSVMESLVSEFSQELNKIGFDTNSFNNRISNINETIELLKKRVDDNEIKINNLIERVERLERRRR